MLAALLVGTVAEAQNPTPEQANNRVAELINSADYVTLAAELPAVREMVVESLRTLADVLVAHSEGRFEDSNRAIGQLGNYTEQLGAATIFAMQNFALINHLASEDYLGGKATVEQLIAALPAEASSGELKSIHRWMSALCERERVEVVRPKGDVVIPVERRRVGRGEHLIVRGKAGAVSEDFIFDTGCSYANMVSRAAAERLGVSVKDVIFLDDNYNADKTAKDAGTQVYGVYDASSADYAEQIKAVCDRYICDFDELL